MQNFMYPKKENQKFKKNVVSVKKKILDKLCQIVLIRKN